MWCITRKYKGVKNQKQKDMYQETRPRRHVFLRKKPIIVVSVYFVVDSVRKLLNIPSYVEEKGGYFDQERGKYSSIT
jgi:hypothetical protein